MANTKKRIRQENALKRLQSQLKSGVKNVTERTKNFAGILQVNKLKLQLDEKDITRINKEMRTLQSRI